MLLNWARLSPRVSECKTSVICNQGLSDDVPYLDMHVKSLVPSRQEQPCAEVLMGELLRLMHPHRGEAQPWALDSFIVIETSSYLFFGEGRSYLLSIMLVILQLTVNDSSRWRDSSFLGQRAREASQISSCLACCFGAQHRHACMYVY